MNRLIVQSHRGGGALAPENTLESFEATWKLGAVPEADLRTTSDGVIVAFHDKDFSRVVKDASPELRVKGVRDVTFAELSALDVGAWLGDEYTGQRVRRIEEIFALMQGRADRALYMDIKEVDLAHLAVLARQFGVTKQVILASPKDEQVQQWIELIPEAQTLLWMGILWKGDEDTLRGRLANLHATNFAGVTQLQMHVQAQRVGEEWHYKPSLEYLHEVAGELRPREILFQALPWLCADLEVYRALLGIGVESFASDYPAVALQALRENSE